MASTETHPDPHGAPALPASLRLGPVHLTVSDLDGSIGWYERALGLSVHRRDEGLAELGADGEPVVVLHEVGQARPAGRHAGLYHYALLYPSREELARAAQRVATARAPIQGASDHGTHEAIYLPDLEGNGIELAADRPRERWPAGLGYERGPAPLDLEALLGTVAGEPLRPPAAGLRVGHMHLQVGDIREALAFYRDILGFGLQANLGSAAFVSAGGYHHHLAFNVWSGEGVGPAPPGTVGLHHWTVVLPGEADVAAVRARMEAARMAAEPVPGGLRARDPWQLAVDFVAAQAIPRER